MLQYHVSSCFVNTMPKYDENCISCFCGHHWSYIRCSVPNRIVGNTLASHLLGRGSIPVRAQVGKLVVACRWSAVYSTQP